MKNILFLIPAILISVSYSFSQATHNKTVQSSLLWEISGKNLNQPSYLFGTMHLMPKADFYFPETLQNKLRKADVLVMEIAGLSEKAKAIQYMQLDSGIVWDYFTQSQLDSIFTYAVDSLGYNKDKMKLIFSKMKPFVLLQLFTKNKFGSQPKSYELSFEKIAREDSIPIVGLETIEDQMSFIDELNPEKQVAMIMQSIRSVSKTENNSIKELIAVYLSQDINKIRAFINDSQIDSPEFEATFLNNRNKNWIRPIQKIIKKQSTFIAVGAAHLGGQKGVVALLKAKGYTLTPIKF